MPTCFVAMPITTPDPLLYQGDVDHFRHVYDCFFSPAIVAAGFSPVPPAAQGADIIHASIISNIEKSDLVLCDMSGLNANVFFEFGIRTALNRPVCLVVDEKTTHIPFDTHIINRHVYKSTLNVWDMSAAIVALADHIKASYERSANENGLWKHFGLAISASPAESETNADEKITLLAQQVQRLSEALDKREEIVAAGALSDVDSQGRDIYKYVRNVLASVGLPVISFSITPIKQLIICVPKEPPSNTLLTLHKYVEKKGWSLAFVVQ